ncbi:dephospho-CoA kinase [Pseudoalteromonas piratica]|uniref:Dephospho-CoA kinase n=1 Tax=Pseudoalteromonas piratica TaxID=1348114 RepID=A0A0A7EJ65_9GAMM|nr:dephospho-CoA kinase [Pseudoalteromonas piratica]AIY66086.1 dephospho-CoA kinase [Pseudoalteromonas piratica]
MSALILGLTGGIASGKSTVSGFFQQLGITIVDADLIAREVVSPNSPALIEITNQFGDDILLPSGELNRAQLRHIIFQDTKAKTWLNALLHPLIRQELVAQLNSAKGPYVVLDAPLLFENGLEKLCAKTVVVDIPKEMQISRATKRDKVTQEQIRNIIEAQMPREEKLAKADIIIDNSKSIENTQSQVNSIHLSFKN